MRRLSELAYAYRTPLHAAFIDYTKAFDCINREALWRILADRGVDHHLIDLVRDLYDGCEGEVVVQGVHSARFSMNTGVRQGCALSPMLFNTYIDHVTRESFSSTALDAHCYPIAFNMDGLLQPHLPASAHTSTTNTARIIYLLYADDLVLLSCTREGLTAMLRQLESTSSKWAMTINYKKTKTMEFHAPSHATTTANTDMSTLYAILDPCVIALAHGSITHTLDFIYLGSKLTHNGDLQPELDMRIAKTRGVLRQLDKVWRHRHLPIHIKSMVYQAFGPPTLLYGSEAWAITDHQAHQLDVVQNDCLRRILHKKPGEHLTLEALRQRCGGIASIPSRMRTHRLRFLGHTARRPDYRMTKQLLFTKYVPGATGTVRQIHNIVEVLRDDLEGFEQYQDWYLHAQDRSNWRAEVVKGNHTRH